MAEPEASYLFQPLEKRGVLLGLEPAQLLTLAAGILFAVLMHAVLRSTFGLFAAVMAFVVSGVIALWSRHGAPLCFWAAQGAAFVLRGSRRLALTSVPLAGSVHPKLSDRTAPPGIELCEEIDPLSGSSLGFVRDRRAGALVGVIPVRGHSFTLMDSADQVRHLEGWRRVLGAAARPGTPIARLQWIGRCRPMAAGSLPSPPQSETVSYRQFVEEIEPGIQQFDSWVVVSVGAAKRSARVEDLLRELRLLSGQVRQAGLDAGEALSLTELLTIFAADGRASRRVWPSAVGDEWAAARIDGWWHATYWIAEWPRVGVGPAFLAPLLLGSGRRTVSVVMSPVPAEQALRQARSAMTADIADGELRARAGFLPAARREKEAEGAARRELELADGHCEFRFSGYVTVAAPDPEALRAACSDTEHQAQSAHIEIRRLFGRQAEAYTWTLPLARGLR